MKSSVAWHSWHLPMLLCVLLGLAARPSRGVDSVTVPIVLDHNRMLVEAETQAADGSPLPLAVAPPRVHIGGMPHNDANLPSTVLRQFQVIFDYPRRQLTLAPPGTLAPRGVRAAAAVHPTTGIVQIDAVIAGDSLGLALERHMHG